MLVLNQEAVSRREKIPLWLENCTCDEKNIDVLQFPVDVMKLSNAERFLIFPFFFPSLQIICNQGKVCSFISFLFRFLWYNGWKDKANILLKTCFSQAQGTSFAYLIHYDFCKERMKL